MIEDAMVAFALGWKREERERRIKMGDGWITAPIIVWIDESGNVVPLRPFTESYDVMIDEIEKRGFHVAFRSDEDMAMVWKGDDKENAVSSHGLKLVEGMALCLVYQISLQALPQQFLNHLSFSGKTFYVPHDPQPQREAERLGEGPRTDSGPFHRSKLEPPGRLLLPEIPDAKGD